MLSKKKGLAGLFVVLLTAPLSQMGGLQVSSAESQPDWLLLTNRYRASAGLNDVTESPEASAGALAHSRYMVRNKQAGHVETPGAPSYSENGLQAGQTGNVAAGSGAAIDQRDAVESWLTVPFHGANMLSPESTRFGYGIYADAPNTRWAASMPLFWDLYQQGTQASSQSGLSSRVESMAKDLISRQPEVGAAGYTWSCRGTRCVLVSGTNVFVTENGAFVARPGVDSATASHDGLAYDKPVVWPGRGTGVPLNSYAGDEFPDPLTSCAGFRMPVGLPIYVLRGKATELTDASVQEEGVAAPLQLCVLSAKTYVNTADLHAQESGRGVLESNGGVVLLPRNPLTFGRTYNVRVLTTDGESISWSFRVTTNGNIDLPPGHPKANERTVGIPSQPAITLTSSKLAQTQPRTLALTEKTKATPKRKR